jgi:hypothetical protein
MTIMTSVTEIEDRFVAALRDIQRPMVDYVRKGVERAEGRIPRLNYPAQLPRPTEIVDSQVEFAKALIDSQRDFARDLAGAVAPLVEPGTGTDVAVPTPPATTTTKPKAAKPAARKNAAKRKA